MNLDSKISQDSPVRLVNQVVDNPDISKVIDSYKGGGTSSYPPRVMLKGCYDAGGNGLTENQFICRFDFFPNPIDFLTFKPFVTGFKERFKQNFGKVLNRAVADSGYGSEENYEGCPLKCMCYKAKGNRRIEVNHNLNRHKERVRQLLTSEERLYHRSMRPIESESMFGQGKSN